MAEIIDPEEFKKSLQKTEDSGKPLVLVVDDEDSILVLADLVLKRSGYNVQKASNGLEALDVFDDIKDKVSMAIIDLIMPGMHGDELIDKLLEIQPNLNILLTTGANDPERIKKILQTENVKFLEKPYNMPSLIKAVESATT